MPETFFTCCGECSTTNFRSRRALETHYAKKHPGCDPPTTARFFDNETRVYAPEPKLLAGSRQKDYLDWLTNVVDCLNSTHNPKAPGKWCHINLNCVPVEYLCHLLCRIGSAELHSVKRSSHLRAPIWKEKALKFSYKSYEMDDLKQALNEQERVTFCEAKAFRGSAEVPLESMLKGREALEAARKGNFIPPSCRSEFIIGEGEGRATREVEIIWWSLFSNKDYGKMVIRLYIGKANI